MSDEDRYNLRCPDLLRERDELKATIAQLVEAVGTFVYDDKHASKEIAYHSYELMIAALDAAQGVTDE